MNKFNSDELKSFKVEISKDTYIKLIHLKVIIQKSKNRKITWNEFIQSILQIYELYPSEGIFPQDEILKIEQELNKRKKKSERKKKIIFYQGNLINENDDELINLNGKGNPIL